METKFNRRCGEDSPDCYELFYRKFNIAPNYVYKGGGTGEYAGYDLPDADEILNKNEISPLDAIKELNKVADLFIEKLIQINEFKNAKDGDKHYHYRAYDNIYQIFREIPSSIPVIISFLYVPTSKHTSVCLYAMANHDNGIKAIEQIIKLITNTYTTKVAKKDEIKIISQEGGGFYMSAVNLSKRQHTFDYDNYNDDFKPVAQRVIRDLKVPNASGLALFHGDVGTGKTSFLKFLVNTIDTKQLIYLPPDLTSSLSSPSFVNFLITNATNSILLIEDAENVLKHREAGGSQAVSNILNISDGILGDVLKTQIVCTFNCPRDELDVALFRPGRLLVEFEFTKLKANKVDKLMKKIYGDDVVYENQDMSLAEIYNFAKMPDKSNPDRKKQKLGFI